MTIINPDCPLCDGDGYTEKWNDDQSGVITDLCECPAVCENCHNPDPTEFTDGPYCQPCADLMGLA